MVVAVANRRLPARTLAAGMAPDPGVMMSVLANPEKECSPACGRVNQIWRRPSVRCSQSQALAGHMLCSPCCAELPGHCGDVARTIKRRRIVLKYPPEAGVPGLDGLG